MSNKKQQDSEEIKDLLREVEDDMALESLKDWVKRNAGTVVAVVLAVILVVGGGSWYRTSQDGKALKAEETFTDLVYPETNPKKGPINEAALPSSTGYQTLVSLAEAKRHLDHDRPSETVDVWQKALKTAPLPLRNLLVVALGNAQRSEQTKGVPEESLAALAQSKVSPWRFLAQERFAFERYAAGDLTAAKKSWEALSKAEEATPGVRDRAQTMLKSFL
jgi:hypothetical protein